MTELTVTPPLTDAVRRLANPAPGSKNPEPALEVPETVTIVEARPVLANDGVADAGVAGGGASSFATRTP